MARGTYTGTLCINSNDPDEPLVQVPVEMEVVPNPAITLAKTVGTDPSVCATTDSIEVPAGTEVTYCYMVTNTGDVSFDLHSLVDSELGLILEDFTYFLNPGTSAFITATAVITETTVNTATWNAADTADGFGAQATDTATVTVLGEADLAVEKTAPAEVVLGATFQYDIVVSNNGPADATGVVVVDTLPAGVTFVSASAGCVNTADVVTCNVGALAADASITLSITVVAPDVEGDLVNTVVVTGDETDPDVVNNTDTATTAVVPAILEVYLPLMFKAPPAP
jgi:uncharacterized repeat protein (TIGR01451 family)